MNWSAKQYSAFENERTRPVRDLVAALPNERVARAVDLGCGPGNSTEVLAARYPDAAISGTDNSQDMIDAARKRLPGLSFELSDIAAWNPPGGYDVILANASLQWVPGHEELYPRLVGKLAPGGSLAVRPRTTWKSRRTGWRARSRRTVPGPPGSARSSTRRATAPPGTTNCSSRSAAGSMWRTIYLHPGWRGGGGAMVHQHGAQAYLGPLDPAEQQAFLAEYQARIERAYPACRTAPCCCRSRVCSSSPGRSSGRAWCPAPCGTW